jgi:hypothetical protein
MSAVAFDTLKFVERLEAGGFTPSQAKAAASAFADATGEQLVTRQALREDLAPIKSDLREAELRLDAKLTKVEGEITLLKWMLGLVIAGILALVLKAYFPH